MTLPPITFKDMPLPGVDLDMNLVMASFPHYLTYPSEKRLDKFVEDLRDERQVLATIIKSVGLGADGLKILAGIGNRVKTLRRYIALQKVFGVAERLPEIMAGAEGRKVVVFAAQKAPLDELHAVLKDYNPVKMFAGTPTTKCIKIVDRFQNKDHCCVAVIQISAASAQMVLTAADTVIFVESDWSGAEANAQAVMRVHNGFQDKPVTVYFTALEGTDDLRVQRVFKIMTRTLVGASVDSPDIFSE